MTEDANENKLIFSSFASNGVCMLALFMLELHA